MEQEKIHSDLFHQNIPKWYEFDSCIVVCWIGFRFFRECNCKTRRVPKVSSLVDGIVMMTVRERSPKKVAPFLEAKSSSHHYFDVKRTIDTVEAQEVDPSPSNNDLDTQQELERRGIGAFSHRLNANWCQILQIILMSCTLAPLRLCCFFIVLLLNYCVCRVGLIGLSDDRLIEGPLLGWRRGLQAISYGLGRIMYFTLGLHWVTIKGDQASPREAPVLVVAPHATFVDTIAVIMSGATPVGKDDFKDLPILGVIGKFVQILFVKRENPQSRKLALQEIRKHTFDISKSKAGEVTWRQLLIFPEGTCTNGKALIYFKVGAFQNNVPVQPVIIRYPNRLDTLTWTWDQSYGALGCLWLTLCQFYIKTEIEFLPVQIPAGSAAQDPRVFAHKIRQVISDAMGIPVIDLRLEDGKLSVGSRDVLHVVIEEDIILDPSKLGYNYVDFTGNLGLGM
ncbi:lysophosphatidylcholine acyltransferase 1-like isoform X1 [Tigriopus californicus]|uniref:lysophosphatidylcholine acyltransferase 1-like isoform X1 n=2 Tax=Tigriopus californicus TaxID=6832 RepID=UPI0027DA4752|nr:lysophosphatidylcholine acyltransferase 1-like isoform X1 [Tigriopus californicus]